MDGANVADGGTVTVAVTAPVGSGSRVAVDDGGATVAGSPLPAQEERPRRSMQPMTSLDTLFRAGSHDRYLCRRPKRSHPLDNISLRSS